MWLLVACLHTLSQSQQDYQLLQPEYNADYNDAEDEFNDEVQEAPSIISI